MRTASLLTILMMIPILFASTTLAAPPTSGTTTVVSDAQTWNGGNFNGDVVIADGGVLTWTGESQITTDSTITVEEGGTLNLNDAMLTGHMCGFVDVYRAALPSSFLLESETIIFKNEIGRAECRERQYI